jgi:heptosyltransferase-2
MGGCADYVTRPALKLLGERTVLSLEDVRSVVVLEYWHLGDAVMIIPFLRALREKLPQARIVLVGSHAGRSVLGNQRIVDEILVFRIPWAQAHGRFQKLTSGEWSEVVRLVRELRRRRFDLGFSGRADVRDNALLWAGGVKRRIGYGFGNGAAFLTDIVPPDIGRPHYAERWLRLVEFLWGSVEEREPRLWLSEDQQRFANEYLKQCGVGEFSILVGIHPGARNEVRQWGWKNFYAVASRLVEKYPKVRVLWFEDPEKEAQFHASPSWLCPVRLPLGELMGVLAKCRLLICNDSGPMHLAAALGVPVVAVFGPGSRAWSGPLHPQSKVVINDAFWCRPCFDYCRWDRPYCLEAVPPDDVYTAAVQLIEGAQEGWSGKPC